MRYKPFLIPIIFIGILFANNSAKAQNTYAVLVGISDYYKNNDLPTSVKDLEKFKEFLMSENGNKTPDSNIVFIKNKEATKQNIIKQSKDLFSKAKPNDRVFFYFSGHGSNGFFCAYDSMPKDEYLYFYEVKDIFKSAKYNTKISFIRLKQKV